jgi:hypothetical protein
MTTHRGSARIVRFWSGARLLAGLLACGLLASCASLVGPRQVEIPLHKLQAGVDRRFPVNNRALELFDIHLSRPHLTLLADTNRVALDMDAYVAPPFMKQSWSGSLALSGRLVVDASRSAVVITDPHVDRFIIDGMDAGRQRQLSKFANALVGEAVTEMPIYSFRMEDLRFGSVQFVPTRIETTPNALVVTLEPAK